MKTLAEGLIVDGEKEILRFISRLPTTFGLKEKITTKAFAKNEWFDAGKFLEKRDAAFYIVQKFTDYIDEGPYRFLVVHSLKLDGRRKKAINRAIKKTEKELTKAIKDTTKASFACEKDAKLVGDDFLKKHKNQYFLRSYTIEKEEKRKPGRPAKDYIPNYVYCLNIEIKRDEEAITEIKKQKSCFIQISNAFDKFSSYELLKEYKGQTNVEIP